MDEIFESMAPEETAAIGERLGRDARPGEVYCLSGDLGVGKTVFTKGFAKGLGVSELVTSPTFTIMNIYEGERLPLYHFDVYRVSDGEELEETGCTDFFYGSGVCLVEWAEIAEDVMPEDALWVTIEKDFGRDEDYRRITLRRKGGGRA